MNDNRIKQEIEHGKNIVRNAELFWGWSTPAGQRRMSRRVEIFIQRGEIGKGKNILEIGCGTGLFTKEIIKSGAEVTAIDISPDLLEKARQSIQSPNVTFTEMNAYSMTFPDNTFDCVYGSSVLHHLELENALRNIYRVCKRGATIIFTEPNMLNPQIMIQKNVKCIKRFLGDSPQETAFIRWQLSKILRNLNFKSINIIPFDFLHPWMPSALINTVEKIGNIAEKTPLLKEISGSLIITANK